MPIDWKDYVSNPWLQLLVAALVLMVVVSIATRIAVAVLKRVAKHFSFARILLEHVEQPLLTVVPLLALQGLLGSASDELLWINGLRHLTTLALIAAITWFFMGCVRAVEQSILIKHPLDIRDNLNARRIQTQTRVLVRTLWFLVLLVGVSVMLMTFPPVRQIGTTILASAGLIGLAAGLAAKPVLGNLIAGLQIAVTQPIRMDDVVIVEGEWGRIEEITGTYVVVRIWDDRRMVLPLQWFIENPFQNWTRKDASILGSVFLWVDYLIPLEPLRSELQRLCEEIPHLWDGRVSILQVTDTSEKAMQLRILVSSPDASLNFDARCYVREKLIAFIGREFPQSLPQLRTDIHSDLDRGKPTPPPEQAPPTEPDRQPPV